MKRARLLIFPMLIVLILCACTDKNVKKEGKLNVVTSFYPMYIATANIVDGVSDINLKNLTSKTTGCLHDYQITTQDMIKLSDADVLVINGGGMENFIDKALSTYTELKIINASQNIKENHEIEHKESHDEHHDHGDNSHYWVSISLYIEQVKNIKDELCRIDVKNAFLYEMNANNYISKLEELKTKMHNSLDNIDNKNIVTFHEAFDYFAEEFDLDIVAVIEREPGTYPSSRDVAEIIDEIKDKNVNAIFVEPQYSRTAADTIARETHVNVYELDPIVTGELNKDAYINTMNKNLDVLENAFKGWEHVK